MIDLSDDLQVLWATIDGEAESEVLLGKQAVGCTPFNRMAMFQTHPHFGDGTIRGACLAPKQYSCWNPGPDHDRIMAMDINNTTEPQQISLDVAQALMRKFVDITGDATYYFSRKIGAPFWVPGAMFCGLFGTQLFWKGIK